MQNEFGMNLEGFYKKDDNNNTLIYSPDYVSGPGWDLIASLHDTYEYPFDGWYWFSNEDQANSAILNTIQGAPKSITMFQAKAALYQAGLLNIIDNYMKSNSADPLVALAWEYASVFERNSPAVLSISQLLNISDKELDQLFINGSQIFV